MLKLSRLVELDWLRGLAMILMALDHARYLVSVYYVNRKKDANGIFETWFHRIDNDETTDLLRLTSHVCAPIFFFLLGASQCIVMSRKLHQWSYGELIKHFSIRALVIMAIGFVLDRRSMANGIVSLSVMFGLGVNLIIGCVMMILVHKLRLSLLISTLALSLSCLIISQYASIEPTESNLAMHYNQEFSLWSILSFVVSRTKISFGDHISFYVENYYPFFPWLSYVFYGQFYALLCTNGKLNFQGVRKATYDITFSNMLFATFCVIRLNGGWGNSIPTDSTARSVLDFFYVIKYPPSIAYFCLTMSLVHGCLWFFTSLKDIEMKNDKLSVSSLFEHLRILGQTSLFFYIVHYVLYFMMGLIIKQALGFTAGMEVRGLLFCWLLGLMIVYPLCKAYRAWKLKQKPDSIFLLL